MDISSQCISKVCLSVCTVFFKDATKIQNGPKVQNFKVEIIQILQSRSPRYRDVQVFFQGFTEIQSSWMNFKILCSREKRKIKVINNSHFTITIWNCAGDFTEI